MGRFEHLVQTPALIELFKEKYHIPQEVVVRHCTTEGVEFDRKVGEVVIPMIAFIERGMTIPMGRITRDYLRAYRLCPHQCAPNFFRVLGSIDALDRHLGLGLTWHDVAHLYEGHIESRVGFTLSPVATWSNWSPASLNLTRGWKPTSLSCRGHGVTA